MKKKRIKRKKESVQELSKNACAISKLYYLYFIIFEVEPPNLHFLLAYSGDLDVNGLKLWLNKYL